MKRIYFWIIWAVLIWSGFGCRKEEVAPPPPAFVAINIEAVFLSSCSKSIFRVDSAKIFFAASAPQGQVYYGVLPDSIFNIVRQYVAWVQENDTIKYEYKDSDDDDFLAVEIITEKGSIHIRQNPIDIYTWGSFLKPITGYFYDGRFSNEELLNKYQSFYLWWDRPDTDTLKMDTYSPRCFYIPKLHEKDR